MSNPKIHIRCKEAEHISLWVDCIETDWQKIDALAKELVKSSPEEDDEWEICETANFHGLEIANDEDLDNVCQWAEIVLEYEKVGVFFIKKMQEMERDADLMSFDTHYIGCFETLEDFAQEYITEKYKWEALFESFPFWAEHIAWDEVVKTIKASESYQFMDDASGVHVFNFEAQNG